MVLLAGANWLASVAHAQSEMTIARTVVDLTASDQALLPGQQLKLTALVAMEDGGEVPGGIIEFIDETQNRIIGRTSASAPWIVLHRLSDGSHTFRAHYSGLQSYFPFVIEPSTSTPLVYTVRTVPRVVISSSQNPSMPGQAVTLTVAVKSRDGTPRGDVTIRDVALDSNGMASFTTSGLEQGSRTIVASYHGDAKNASAVSTQLMQIVSPEHMHGGQSSR
ncbi:MAG: Ig-like domain repeat protein [Rhizobiales bacterium]|nr:Ig-like domain repeat protein [Hyphomicrobiales bacterium]